jgi:F0F1-type ATP synthase membrane subunit b/b'
MINQAALKPIAIDLGRIYWVIARTDDNGQPTVASLGDGGLIPALISEYQGQPIMGQWIESDGGIILRDCYQWLLGKADAREELGKALRETTTSGEWEVFMGGHWWSTTALLSRLFAETTKVVKDYLAPHSMLPVVAAVSPEIDPRLFEIYRKAMFDAGLSLCGWCPYPLALAYADPNLLQCERSIVASILVDWGEVIFGIVEIKDQFAHLRASGHLEWSWMQGQQLPLEQIPYKIEQLLSSAQEYYGISADMIDGLLMGGEEGFIHQLYPVISQEISAPVIPHSNPRLSVSMGAAWFAQQLSEGLFIEPIVSPVSKTKITLGGFASPKARIDIQGGPMEEELEVPLTGILNWPLELHTDSVNKFSLQIEMLDGRHFVRELEITHSSKSPDELIEEIPSELIEEIPSELIEEIPSELIEEIPSELIEEIHYIKQKTSDSSYKLASKSQENSVLLSAPSEVRSKSAAQNVGKQFEQEAAPVASAKLPLLSEPKIADSDDDWNVDIRSQVPIIEETSSAGESTHPDLAVPDEMLEEGEQMSISSSVYSYAPLDDPAKELEAPPLGGEDDAPFELDQADFSFGEGDGETRILTKDSYSKLLVKDSDRLENKEHPMSEHAQEDSDGAMSYSGMHSIALEDLSAGGDDWNIAMDVDKKSRPQRESSNYRTQGSSNSEQRINFGTEPPDKAEPQRDLSTNISGSKRVSGLDRDLGRSSISLRDEAALLAEFDGLETESNASGLPVHKADRQASDDLEVMAAAVEQKRLRHRRTQLGVKESSANESAVQPSESASNTSQPSLSAGQRSENRLATPTAGKAAYTPVPSSSEPDSSRFGLAVSGTKDASHIGRDMVSKASSSPEAQIRDKLEQARRLAREARQLMEESHSIAAEIDMLYEPAVYALLWESEDSLTQPLEMSTRREARKIMELGKQLIEVEDNRLPTSTRKTLARLIKELETHLENKDGSTAIRLVLQLANRMFDTIRRDLRPW